VPVRRKRAGFARRISIGVTADRSLIARSACGDGLREESESDVKYLLYKCPPPLLLISNCSFMLRYVRIFSDASGYLYDFRAFLIAYNYTGLFLTYWRSRLLLFFFLSLVCLFVCLFVSFLFFFNIRARGQGQPDRSKSRARAVRLPRV